MRVLSRAGFIQTIGRTGKAKGGRKYDQESKLPVFLTAKSNLKPYIPDSLIENSTPVPFRTITGTVAMGYKAELLPMVCNVFLDAKEDGKLRPNQLHIAESAESCNVGLRWWALPLSSMRLRDTSMTAPATRWPEFWKHSSQRNCARGYTHSLMSFTSNYSDCADLSSPEIRLSDLATSAISRITSCMQGSRPRCWRS